MTMNIDGSPLLVCPRPVRLAQSNWLVRPVPSRPAADKLNDENDPPPSDFRQTQSPSPNPRLSSRSPFQNEAMDEFLSILKPSLPAFFPPAPPMMRSYAFAAHERSRSLKLSRLEVSTEDADAEAARTSTPSRGSNRSDVEDEVASPTVMSMAADLTGRWLRSAILSSPVSRTNGARNPFTKVINNTRLHAPPPPSPASIPLPPTPEPYLES